MDRWEGARIQVPIDACIPDSVLGDVWSCVQIHNEPELARTPVFRKARRRTCAAV
jgi:hypothetical protein